MYYYNVCYKNHKGETLEKIISVCEYNDIQEEHVDIINQILEIGDVKEVLWMDYMGDEEEFELEGDE